MNKSGGRQPAVVRKPRCNGDRFATAARTVYRGKSEGTFRPWTRRTSTIEQSVQSRYRKTHGGLTPPALVLVCGRLPVKKRLLRCTNAHQERRASARRGFANRVCNGDRVSRGGHVSTVDPARTSYNRESQSISGNRRSTRAAGVSPPWFASRVCNGDRVSRGMIAFLAHDRHQATMGNKGSIVGGVITFPAHVRHSNHGWLTPAALDSDVRMRLHRNASVPPVRLLATGG
jgi:hypothetical protein